ncbi:MAG: bifunctional UDP-sugar hydrolase/5'-nucleotidase [Candidatus Kapabacteria bacterium]|nr:bifunctional UDP-sugar hydrolase/5'-nucleotidase [Candidatus Kapabacteria bacterium]
MKISILYTSDEHGWIDSSFRNGGAASMMTEFKQKEGYDTNKAFLLISGGDNWTGPAISTITKGEATVETMNAMHYSLSALGNHEFDFGIENIKKNLSEASFPYLSANFRRKSDHKIPEFVKPYIIKTIQGVKVGIIGLSNVATPGLTKPANVEGYEFLPYISVLTEYTPQLLRDSAEILIAIIHDCSKDIIELSALFKSLGYTFVGTGHCHSELNSTKDGVAFIEPTSNFMKYARVDIDFDKSTKKVISLKEKIEPNTKIAPDADVKKVINKWRDITSKETDVSIGYTKNGIQIDNDILGNLVVDSWLAAFPEAQISMSNRHGIRQIIPVGNITLASIMGVLPFENEIYIVKLTGEQIIDNIKCCKPYVGGLVARNGFWLANGEKLDRNKVYKVVITDYIYSNGDKFKFKGQDSQPFMTGINFRQPLIDLIKTLKTSPDNPLDDKIDKKGRY